MLWRPPISNEFAFRETRERYDLVYSGIFKGTPTGDEGYYLPVGFVGTGISAAVYPPRGKGEAFLLTLSSSDGRNLKPGRYSYNPDDEVFRADSFSVPEFYTEYNMNDFEPRIGSIFHQCSGGSINIYAFSESEINLSWALEMTEYTDTGAEPEPTGRSSIADGNYKGEYKFYDVPITTEHKGFNFDGVFYPLGKAATFSGEKVGDNYSIPIVIGGPDALTSVWPMSGIGSFVELKLISEFPDSVPQGRYEFVDGGTEPGDFSFYTTVNEVDFSNFAYVDGSLVYLPVGGFCNVLFFSDDFMDMLWTMEIDEYLFDGKLEPTGNSYTLNGAYSGPLTYYGFARPVVRWPTEVK